MLRSGTVNAAGTGKRAELCLQLQTNTSAAASALDSLWVGLQAAPPTHSDGEPGEAKIRRYSGLAGDSTWRERERRSPCGNSKKSFTVVLRKREHDHPDVHFV